MSNQSVDDLDLSVRTANVLRPLGLRTIGELLALERLAIPGQEYRELRRVLAENGHEWRCKLAPLDEASAARSLGEAVDRLRGLEGVVVTPGVPMDALAIARAEKQLGIRFPPDYRGFLSTFGSLAVYREGPRTSIWENTFIAGSPHPTLPEARFEGVVGVVELSRRVRDEARRCDDGFVGEFAAVLLSVNGVNEAYVLREDGFIGFLEGGTFHESDPFGYDFEEAFPVTLEMFFVDWLERARRKIDEEIALAASYERLFGALAKMAADAGAAGAVRRNGGYVFLRDDGTEVSLRPGDGNELHGRARGLFYAWHEPASGETLAALNGRLLAAHASEREDGARVRGLVPLELPAAEVAWVLAQDTGLRFAGAKRPSVITAEDLEAAFVRDLGIRRTVRQVERIAEGVWTFESGRDESRAAADEDVKPGASSLSALFDIFASPAVERKPPPGFAFTLRLDDGLVTIEAVHHVGRELADDAAAFVNGGATSTPHAFTNLDHEAFVLATAEGDAVVLRRRLYALRVGKLDLLATACRELEWAITISLRYFDRERYRAESERWASRRRAAAAILAEVKAGARQEAVLDDGDFQGQSLESREWAGVSARRARFGEANLQFTTFDGGDLRDADFTGANCSGASFVGCDLRGANFTDARLDGANFLFAISGPQFW